MFESPGVSALERRLRALSITENARDKARSTAASHKRKKASIPWAAVIHAYEQIYQSLAHIGVDVLGQALRSFKPLDYLILAEWLPHSSVHTALHAPLDLKDAAGTALLGARSDPSTARPVRCLRARVVQYRSTTISHFPLELGVREGYKELLR